MRERRHRRHRAGGGACAVGPGQAFGGEGLGAGMGIGEISGGGAAYVALGGRHRSSIPAPPLPCAPLGIQVAHAVIDGVTQGEYAAMRFPDFVRAKGRMGC